MVVVDWEEEEESPPPKSAGLWPSACDAPAREGERHAPLSPSPRGKDNYRKWSEYQDRIFDDPEAVVVDSLDESFQDGLRHDIGGGPGRHGSGYYGGHDYSRESPAPESDTPLHAHRRMHVGMISAEDQPLTKSFGSSRPAGRRESSGRSRTFGTTQQNATLDDAQSAATGPQRHQHHPWQQDASAPPFMTEEDAPVQVSENLSLAASPRAGQEQQWRSPRKSATPPSHQPQPPQLYPQPVSMPPQASQAELALAAVKKTAAAAAAKGNPVERRSIVKMGRMEAWTKFASYEACIQVCHSTLLDPHLETPHLTLCRAFLYDRCALLRSAFGLGGLLLEPAQMGSETGADTIFWDDSEDSKWTGVSSSATHSEVLRVEVADIKLSNAGKGLKWLGSKLKGGQPAQGWGSDVSAVLYPKVRPTARVEWAQTVVELCKEGGLRTSTTNIRSGKYLEVLSTDAEGEGTLLLELMTNSSQLARAKVNISDIWQNEGEEGREAACDESDCSSGRGPRTVGGSGTYWQTWVRMEDAQGHKVGKLLLGVWTHTTASVEDLSVEEEIELSTGSGQQHVASNGAMQLSAQHMYEATLQAALNSLACGPRRLEVTGEWQWLLDRLASIHALRTHATLLAHLQWVLRPPNATPTSDCLDLLTRQLGPLLSAKAAGELPQTELACLQRLLSAADGLLGRTLELYRRLSDGVESGVLEAGEVSQQIPPPALTPAIHLFTLLRDPLDPSDQGWLLGRLRFGARSRYQRVETDILTSVESDTAGARKAVVSEKMYGAMDRLCGAVLRELEAELEFHRSGVLPSFANVAATAAAEYVVGLAGRLQSCLIDHPPHQPSSAVIQLTQAAGRLQMFLQKHQLGGPRAAAGAGGFDAEGIFGSYVRRWVAASTASLKERCHRLERESGGGVGAASPGAIGGDASDASPASQVAPCAQLVQEMLGLVEAECRKYEALVLMLPAVGVLLEGMAVGVVREVLTALLGACGVDTLHRSSDLSNLKQTSGNGGSTRSTPPTGPSKLGKKLGRLLGGGGAASGGSPARTTSSVESPLRGGASPLGVGGGRQYTPSARETTLLNSLRRLLLKLPQLEAMLAKWCGGYNNNLPPASPSPCGVGVLLSNDSEVVGEKDQTSLPSFSAQFRQLATELRTEYGSAVRASAERLAAAVLAAAPDCISRALGSRDSLPSAAADSLNPLLAVAQTALSALRSAVEERVLVALTRGLWDHVAATLAATAQRLQAGSKSGQALGLWRVHQNAASALDITDNFFKQFLSGALRSGLQAKDLDPPPNAEAAHRLLASGKPALDESYSVF